MVCAQLLNEMNSFKEKYKIKYELNIYSLQLTMQQHYQLSSFSQGKCRSSCTSI